MAEDNKNNNDHSEYEEVCYLCRRPESKAGKMIHIPNSICICSDCMQKTFDSMGNMSGFPGMMGGMPPYMDMFTGGPNGFEDIPQNQKLKKKKKDEAVEYSLGNETIIQPKRSPVRELAGRLAVLNIFIGAVIGAAIIWFLIAPAVNQSRSEKLNDQMRAYSEQIGTLDAQISAQSKTLEQYRAAGEEAQAAVDKANATTASYEKLLSVYDQYRAESVNSSKLADALLEINKDSMSDNGKNLYDSISGDIFPAACKRKTVNAEDSLDSGAYDDAIAELTKVLTMDSTYNDGKAIYLIAQAYQGKQDTENAKKYYQMYLDSYSEYRYADDAQEQLNALGGGTAADGNTGENGTTGE